MVVLAVAAILAWIALPSYLASISKSRRADVVSAVVQVQQAQERYRANQVVYGSTFLVAGGSFAGIGASGEPGAVASYTSPGGYYTLALSGASAASYTVTATAVPGKGQDRDTGCTVLTAAFSFGVSKNTPANCWSN
jgi:type IV pilus assembly protein PilE